MRTNKDGIFAYGEITPGHRHLITSVSQRASAGMAASKYLALQMVKKGEIFEGAKNGKYADEFLAMLGWRCILPSVRPRVELGPVEARFYDVFMNVVWLEY